MPLPIRPAWLFCACALLVAGCDFVRPFEQTCERNLQPASFRVVATPVQHELDLSRSAAQLTASGAAAAGRIVLGITTARLTANVATNGNAITAPFTRRYCIRPNVEVRLALSPLTVAIAREQTPGSCEHGLTLAHEMKHVLVYERAVAEIAATVEARLKSDLGERVRFFSDRTTGEREMPAEVLRVVNPLVEAGMREAARRQNEVDSAEEYDRLDRQQAACVR